MSAGKDLIPSSVPQPDGRKLLQGVGGFTLIEVLIALLILTIGLLASGQLLFVAAGSASLARSQGSAAIVAQNKIEELSALFSSNPLAADLIVGAHGPQRVQILNPANGNQVLNRFDVSWTVSVVPDPRPNRIPDARQVVVTVTPVNTAGNVNRRAFFNKIVSVATVFSPRNS